MASSVWQISSKGKGLDPRSCRESCSGSHRAVSLHQARLTGEIGFTRAPMSQFKRGNGALKFDRKKRIEQRLSEALSCSSIELI